MDIIIAAIAGALGNLSSDVVKAGYSKLKELLQRKFGAESDLADALKKLEKQPDAKWRQDALQGEAEAAGADKDEEIIKAAQALLDAVKAQPGGEKAVQQIVKQITIGDKNIVAGIGDINIKL
ncbi:MAG: hypothetical protein ACTFAK_16215 [Candidatus Electronema sp. VV]